MNFESSTLQVPAHWLSAIINGDESSFDYYEDEKDYQAYQNFCEEYLSNGQTIVCPEDEPYFCTYHDARAFGVLACDVVDCEVLTPA